MALRDLAEHDVVAVAVRELRPGRKPQAVAADERQESRRRQLLRPIAGAGVGEVGHAGRVIEQLPDGDAEPLAGHLRQVSIDGVVQADHPALDQFHHQGRGELFAARSQAVDGFRGCLPAGSAVRQSPPAADDDVAAVFDADRDADDIAVGEKPSHERLDVREARRGRRERRRQRADHDRRGQNRPGRPHGSVSVGRGWRRDSIAPGREPPQQAARRLTAAHQLAGCQQTYSSSRPSPETDAALLRRQSFQLRPPVRNHHQARVGRFRSRSSGSVRPSPGRSRSRNASSKSVSRDTTRSAGSRAIVATIIRPALPEVEPLAVGIPDRAAAAGNSARDRLPETSGRRRRCRSTPLTCRRCALPSGENRGKPSLPADAASSVTPFDPSSASASRLNEPL